ncbi:MAG: hypothetical protein FD153_443 [Rhodospirillaceae bacterium]|nr:MAG: hypothetical protein FD153_443 [Rhodospirillaceae bacterium]
MVVAAPFDTLKLACRLRSAGFSLEQAADIAESLAEAFAIAEVATAVAVRDPAALTGRS